MNLCNYKELQVFNKLEIQQEWGLSELGCFYSS